MAVNVINPVALGPVKLEPGVLGLKNIPSVSYTWSEYNTTQ